MLHHVDVAVTRRSRLRAITAYLAYAAYLAYRVTRSFGAVAHIGGNIGKPFAVFSHSHSNTRF
jgi:hypothetical protein